MSLNTREEILERVFTLLKTLKAPHLPAFEDVVRNREWLDNDRLPAAYLLDGDESAFVSGDRRGRMILQPVMAVMTPQIFVVLKNTRPKNEEVGATLNAYRKEIFIALRDDAQLRALIGSNGDLSYVRMSTDLKSGMTMAGQMQLDFAIRYFVNVYSN